MDQQWRITHTHTHPLIRGVCYIFESEKEFTPCRVIDWSGKLCLHVFVCMNNFVCVFSCEYVSILSLPPNTKKGNFFKQRLLCLQGCQTFIKVQRTHWLCRNSEERQLRRSNWRESNPKSAIDLPESMREMKWNVSSLLKEKRERKRGNELVSDSVLNSH